MNDKLIYEFDKGVNARVRITENEFKGRIYYHLRLFTEVGGTYYPTKTGISFGKDDLPSLFDGIKALQDYVLNGDGEISIQNLIDDLDGSI